MKIMWEKIDCEGWGAKIEFYRTKVLDGWLVWTGYTNGGLAFYPDPDHKWDGNSLP